MILIATMQTSARGIAVAEGPITLHPWRTVWREWLQGLALVRRSRTLSTLFSIGSLQAGAQGIFLVLYVIFVLKIVHGGAAGVGWLCGVQAIGGLLGGLLVGWLGGRVRASSLVGLGTLGFGVIELAIWNSPRFVPGLALPTVLFVAVGLPGAAYGAGLTTMLQTNTTDAYRGRIFGAFTATYSAVQVLGMGLAGILGDRLGVVAVLNAQAGIYILTGLLALALLRRIADNRMADRSRLRDERECLSHACYGATSGAGSSVKIRSTKPYSSACWAVKKRSR